MSLKKFNILYYFGETDSFMQKWQRYHIFSELEIYGYKIEVFNPLHYSTVDKANEKLISHLRSDGAKYDLFMTCEDSKALFRTSIDEAKKIGLPTLLICFDNLHAPHKHKKIAPLFDLVWLTSKETAGYFKYWGCNTVFLPYAANPFHFKPRWERQEFSVCFLGTPYGARAHLINKLISNSVNVSLYSGNTMNHSNQNSLSPFNSIQSISNLIRFPIGRQVLRGAVSAKLLYRAKPVDYSSKHLVTKCSVEFSKISSVYSNHILALNVLELRNTYANKHPVIKIHLRTFEISMSGGLQLSRFSEELAGYFDNDKEILLYSSEEEMISKTKFYLKPARENHVRAMKHAARKRSQSDHTWVKRFEEVFDRL